MTHLSTLVCYQESRQHIPTLSVRVKVTPPSETERGRKRDRWLCVGRPKDLRRKSAEESAGVGGES